MSALRQCRETVRNCRWKATSWIFEPEMSAQNFQRLKLLSGRIAEELVFAQPGTDAGLHEANVLLGEMEALLTADAGMGSLAAAVKPARRWMEEILRTTRAYDAPAAKR